jgi:PKD repeat protein
MGASGGTTFATSIAESYFLALRPGTARVRTIGNHYVTIHVVEETGAKLTINAPKTSIAIDETVQLTAEIESEEPVTETVQWYSSDETTVSVDQNGNIKGLKEGKATITARAGKAIDSVEITVYGPLAANLLTEEEIKANTPTTLKAEVSGGLEPYTYKFTVKVDGEWITIANPDNQSEVSYTFAEPGIYSVCAAVTDANRTTSKSQKKITVKSDEPLKADLIPEENIKAGTPTVFKAEVSGGLEPYTYKFTVKVDGEWITIANPDNQSEVSYTFAEPGTYTVCATVKDTAGTTLKSQKKIIVKNDEPLAVNLVSEESITPGNETILKAEASGGLEPYTYRFTVKINGVWETIANPDNSSEVSYTFPESGIYPVNVTVKDSTGETVKQLQKLYVAEELDVQLAKVSGAKVGEVVTLEGYAEGGIPSYQYKFAVKENGKWVTKRSYSSESTYEWTPKESGNIPVCVYVKDAGGMVTKHQTKIYVSDSE